MNGNADGNRNSNSRMHGDEREITPALVRHLVARQFPHWADQPVTRVPSTGTVNAMFRLGDDMAVRLPRVPGGVEDVALEHDWLPYLAPRLPVPVPQVLGKGLPAPEDGYPWPWTVLRWLDGANPVVGRLTDPGRLARGLAEFVAALRRVDATGGPPAYRGGPLAGLDAATREALAQLGALRERGLVDLGADAVPALTEAWERALAAPLWPGPPVWVHSDLMPGNLLVGEDGGLAAVIDFGTLGVGDPACDLVAAWYVLPPEARETFREALGDGPARRDERARWNEPAGRDERALWERGRGWALSMAALQYPYYRETNPPFAADALRTLRALLAPEAAGLTSPRTPGPSAGGSS
ncbi:aminoglycoside phosphotransferase family protein [Streptomyces albiaxialis]|uniref:Aminoglycoside phosphotransferase family protein n=1 Tax=Streptomyces albiaxialis TaxID=329523 RepID=A0ABN2VKN2_9ACTN